MADGTELPEGWAENLANDEVAFLYEEARQQLREAIQFGTVQDAKAYALLGVSLILISASGIFGDLRVEATPVGVASVAALALSFVVVTLALVLLRVQRWATGADVVYMARWLARGSVGVRRLREAALEEALIPSVHMNDRIIAGRSNVLPGLLIAVVLQTVCVVLVQAFRAVGWSA